MTLTTAFMRTAALAGPETSWGALQDRLLVDLSLAKGDPEAVRRASRRAHLQRLWLLLTDGGRPDPALDAELELVLHEGRIASVESLPPDVPPYTASLESARSFVAATLPGHFVVSGTCASTGHASVGADADFSQSWHEDLAPADGPGRECRAILACAVRALAHQHERQS